jgi:hypothetical protein
MAIYRGDGGSLDGLVESEVILIAISQGGTGSNTAAGARSNLGLGTAATTDASAYATAAQGVKADTATQPGDLGTAAAEDVGYFATAAQGALADSAVQPGDLATVATTGSYNDLTDKPSAGSGTVTSVALSAPTGLSVSGSPVTTSGTLAVTYSAGYAIPTTAKQTEWDTAYTDRLKWDGGSTGLNASTGRTSLGLGTAATTAATDYATAAQGAKADSALQSYTETDPVYVASSWYGTTNNSTNWNTAYTDRLKWDGGATGLTASTGRTSLGATTVGGNLFTLTNPSAVTFVRLNADNTVSALSASDFRTAIGAGTSSTTGTVTSVALSVPTGLSISGSPITSSGTLAITLTAGYSIPTTTSQTNWDTAFGWGNHASAGYLTSSSTLDASKLSGTIDGGTY